MDQVIVLQQKFNLMENRLMEMEEKINSIDGKLTQVVDAILGNPLTKQGGFIEEIANLKDEIKYLKGTIFVLQEKQQKHDVFRNRIIWTIGIIISVGVLAKYIVDVYFTVKK